MNLRSNQHLSFHYFSMKTASLGLLEVMVVRVNAGGMPPDTIIKLKCFI